jgi:hypothetical protein
MFFAERARADVSRTAEAKDGFLAHWDGHVRFSKRQALWGEIL